MTISLQSDSTTAYISEIDPFVMAELMVSFANSDGVSLVV